MSKMRTPRKRSALTLSAISVEPQSTRPRFSSTDMKSRLPSTDGSPCPPGQTMVVRSFGAVGLEMSQTWIPLKFPWKTRLPAKARSELAKPKSPIFAGLTKPFGLSVCETRRRLLIADFASYHPAPSPTRGSAPFAVDAGAWAATGALPNAMQAVARGRSSAERWRRWFTSNRMSDLAERWGKRRWITCVRYASTGRNAVRQGGEDRLHPPDLGALAG